MSSARTDALSGFAVRERAFRPSFVLVSGFVATLLAAPTRSWALWWLAALCLVMALLAARDGGRARMSLLGASVWGLASWLVAHTLFVADGYRPEALYLALYLAGSFAVFARLEGAEAGRILQGALVAVAALLAWGLCQYWVGAGELFPVGGRANALFESPNTLAMLAALGLLVLAARYLERGGGGAWAAALAFFSGLLATQSRGSYVALALAALACLILVRRAGLGLERRRLGRLAAGAAACLLIFELAPRIEWGGSLAGLGAFGGGRQTSIERLLDAPGPAATRLELYALALEGIRERPLAGHGFLSFGERFAARGGNTLRGATTEYVHNDYLQFAFELGLPGLALLAAMAVAAAAALWRALPHAGPDERLALCMTGAGAAYLFAHAGVDFPFYVPAVVVVLGAALGTVERVAGSGHEAPRTMPRGVPRVRWPALAWARRPRLGRIAVVTALAALALPAGAELAAARAQAALEGGALERAIARYRLARALAPHEGYYHWTLGVIWMQVALAERDHAAARRADALFAAGLDRDPAYLPNLLHRLRLHRDHRRLVATPADEETLLEWAERLARARPMSSLAAYEHALTRHMVQGEQPTVSEP